MKTYFYLLALSDGRSYGQVSGTVDVQLGATAAAIHKEVRTELLRSNPQLSATATTTAWVLQPNDLGV